MKVKLIVVLVLIATIFIGAVLWRTDSFIYGDRMSWVEAQTRTQVGAINHSIGTELSSLQRQFANMNAEELQRGHVNWTALAPYYGIASLNIRNQEVEPTFFIGKENSKAARWNKEFVKTAIGNLQGRANDTKFFIKPFQDAQRGRYVGLVFIEGNKGYALFGAGEIFQSLIDAQRGSLGSFSIVTSAGLTVGHTIPEYLGTIMRDDPVFKEATKSASSHGSSIFKTKSADEVYGMFENVPRSNLLVLSSSPLKETMKGRSGLWWQFLLMGAGLVLVGLAGMLWVTSSADKEIEDLQNQLLAEKAKAPMVPMQAPKVVAVDPEQAHRERLDASMRVASALAHEMRGPLASILGYSQMILAKTPEAEVVASTDSILRETRAARGVLDKLLGYAGESVQEKNHLKIEGPVVKALKELEPLFSEKGVTVTKDIQDNTALDVNPDSIIKAVQNILRNSVEAMERMAKKEINVKLFEDADGVHLQISDCGEGIEPANIEKIFDPFFTTRSFQNHMGLGLSVSFGIFKEHNADVQVESQRGQGTTVKAVFKKQQTAAVLKAPATVAEVAAQEEVVMIQDLPKLKEESSQRAEAETAFEKTQAEVAEAAEAAKPSSPLDVNIDSLLELPEQVDAVAIKKVKTKKTPATSNNEFTFIDGFLGEEAVEEEESEEEFVQANSLNAVPVEAAASQSEVLDDEKTASGVEQVLDQEPMAAATYAHSFDDERTVVNTITPPKLASTPKTSKLDLYHVEIRRPGKRI